MGRRTERLLRHQAEMQRNQALTQMGLGLMNAAMQMGGSALNNYFGDQSQQKAQDFSAATQNTQNAWNEQAAGLKRDQALGDLAEQRSYDAGLLEDQQKRTDDLTSTKLQQERIASMAKGLMGVEKPDAQQAGAEMGLMGPKNQYRDPLNRVEEDASLFSQPPEGKPAAEEVGSELEKGGISPERVKRLQEVMRGSPRQTSEAQANQVAATMKRFPEAGKDDAMDRINRRGEWQLLNTKARGTQAQRLASAKSAFKRGDMDRKAYYDFLKIEYNQSGQQNSQIRQELMDIESDPLGKGLGANKRKVEDTGRRIAPPENPLKGSGEPPPAKAQPVNQVTGKPNKISIPLSEIKAKLAAKGKSNELEATLANFKNQGVPVDMTK